MKKIPGKFLVLLVFYSSHCLCAQTSDIPDSANRVSTVSKISVLLENRGKNVRVSDDVKSPFVTKSAPNTISSEIKILQVPIGLSGPELLSQLSAKIPSTATLTFGGNAMLLLGTKKVKVGEKINVSQDGINYELTLVSVTSTSFTVKMGDSLSTRPVKNH